MFVMLFTFVGCLDECLLFDQRVTSFGSHVFCLVLPVGDYKAN
jgi:hypothetical protein